MTGTDRITRSALEDFLYQEAALLDAWELDAWLALFTQDARYIVPSNDKPDGDPRRDLVIIDDNRERLESRVERLKSRHAHREFPISRTRHFVSNVMILGSEDGVVRAAANFLVWRFRGARGDSYVGRYVYEFVTEGESLLIRSKRATLDAMTLDDAGSVSIIL